MVRCQRTSGNDQNEYLVDKHCDFYSSLRRRHSSVAEQNPSLIRPIRKWIVVHSSKVVNSRPYSLNWPTQKLTRHTGSLAIFPITLTIMVCCERRSGNAQNIYPMDTSCDIMQQSNRLVALSTRLTCHLPSQQALPAAHQHRPSWAPWAHDPDPPAHQPTDEDACMCLWHRMHHCNVNA